MYQECQWHVCQFKLFGFPYYHRAELFADNFGRESLAKSGRPKWTPAFQAVALKARKTYKGATQGKTCSSPFTPGLFALICKAPNRPTQREEKMRTAAPVFWHCNSTEGKRQSQHYNRAAETEIFGTLVPGVTLPSCKHFIPFHITFFLLRRKEINSDKQYVILSLNPGYIIKYKYEMNSLAL